MSRFWFPRLYDLNKYSLLSIKSVLLIVQVFKEYLIYSRTYLLRGAVRTGSTGFMEPIDFYESLKKTCKYPQLLTPPTNNRTLWLKSNRNPSYLITHVQGKGDEKKLGFFCIFLLRVINSEKLKHHVMRNSVMLIASNILFIG